MLTNCLCWLCGSNRQSGSRVGKLYKAKLAHIEISPFEIVKWLGDTPRILFIDELNVLTATVEHKEIAEFIKDTFLKHPNCELLIVI